MRYPITTVGTFALLLALAVLVSGSPSQAAAAMEYDGTYNGIITCDALPGDKPLRTNFQLKIVDGRAQYEREVLRANTTIPAGIAERGAGTVSPSGELALTGSATGQGWSYQASYRGQFADKALRLTGAQQWRLPPSGAAHTRPCTITLSRSD